MRTEISKTNGGNHQVYLIANSKKFPIGPEMATIATATGGGVSSQELAENYKKDFDRCLMQEIFQ